jgi:hypothetical protein
MTEFTLNPGDTPELEYPVKVALGYSSPEAKAAVYQEMARRMAGQQILCGVESGEAQTESEDTGDEIAEDAGDESVPSGAWPTFRFVASALLVLSSSFSVLG